MPYRKWWDPDARFLAARLARMNSRYDEAAEHLRACQRMEGATARVQLEWVLLRALLGALDEVEAGLWNCVENNDPDSPFILEVIAGRTLGTLQWDRATRAIKRWSELEPNNPQVWEWQGWVMERLYREEEAENCYRRSLELDPTRERARFWLAELYLTRFKVEDARPLIEQLLREQPDSVAILSAAGQLRFLQGRLDEAETFFDRAVELEPKNAEILMRRARLELQAGRPEKAEFWGRRALALTERRSDIHFLLHQALHSQPGHENEAAAELATYRKYQAQEERFTRLARELIPAHPSDPKYAVEFGDLLFQFDQPEKAVYWHQRALQIDPDFAPAHRALADYYERTGRPEDAARHRSHLPAKKGP
jgi:predicted Zn-dependent protease